MRLTHGSTFSGIGGPEVAAAMLGWNNAFHCEINPFGRKVLDYYFPNAKSYEDITKTDFSEWRGKIDVLTGGFPCQPFSYAGRRGGAEDDRYLWPFMLKCIDQIRPTWFVGENVAGITTMVLPGTTTQMGGCTSLFDEGDHYTRTEQRFVIEEICSNLESIGYSVQPMLVPACAVGAPHRRDRIFFLAHNERDAAYHTESGGDRSGESRADESKSGEERHEIRQLGEPADVRQEVQQPTEDSMHLRCLQRGHEEQGNKWNKWNKWPRDFERICGEERTELRPTTYTDLQRCNESISSTKSSGKMRFNSQESACKRNATHTKSIRRHESKHESGVVESAQQTESREQQFCGADGAYLQDRWRNFPTVSPIHRGNDGLPFDVDNLAIPQGKWRTESLKAYGNAIVPQVILQIFKAIEQTYERPLC